MNGCVQGANTSEHQNGFQRELSVAGIKQILKGGPQQIHHHDIILPFRRAVINLGYSFVDDRVIILQILIQLGLIEELWVFCINLFQFDRHL